MKKFLSLIASLIILCSCAIGFSACGKDGKDGKDGADGTNGTDGKDGVSVENAYIDDEGNLIIKLSDGKEINCGKVTADNNGSLYYRPIITDGNTVAYSVKSVISNESRIFVPSEYNGLPVTGIDPYAFYGCDRLKSVTLCDGIKTIGESAFAKCENLKSIFVDSVESWCNISFANMAANPMYFATEFYAGGKLVSNLVIPDSVARIPDFAFYECENIKSVETGKGVTAIGSSAFYGCTALESVKIGGKVADMGELAFADCTSLKDLQIGNEVGVIGEYAFLRCEKLEEVTVPAGVKRIEASAFSDCTGIRTLNLNDGLEYIGDCAFGGCISLGEFNMPSSVSSIGFGILMFGGSAGFVPGDTSNQVNKITLSDKLTEIPDYSFSYCGITSITISDKVSRISYSAFYGCEQLESLVLPKSLNNIVSFAFYRCSALNTVYYKGTAEEWSAVKIGTNGNDNFTGANDTVPAEVYFYSETRPTDAGNFWHEVNGVPTKW